MINDKKHAHPRSISKSLLFILFFLVIFIAFAFDLYYKDKTTLKFNKEGLTDQKLELNSSSKSTRLELLNHGGEMLYNGWGVNMADNFTLNHWDASLDYLGKKFSWLNSERGITMSFIPLLT